MSTLRCSNRRLFRLTRGARAIPTIIAMAMLFSWGIPNSAGVAARSGQNEITVAASGALDPSFGIGGMVTTDFFGATGYDGARAVVIQPDNKIVAVGKAYGFPIASAITLPYSQFAAARYNTNGTLDSSFSSDGRVLTYFATGDAEAHAVALQPWGIVADVAPSAPNSWRVWTAGYSTRSGTGRDTTLVCYNPNGSLYTARAYDFFETNDEANAIAFQTVIPYMVAASSYDQIVTAGYATSASTLRDFAISTYSTTGSRTHWRTDDFFGQNDEALAMAAGYYTSPAGLTYNRIWAAGYAATGTQIAFALAAYDASLNPVSDFGTGGKVTTDFGGISRAHAIAIQPDGKIVLGGIASWGTVPMGAGTEAVTGGYDFALARYNPDGSLDSTFSTGGKIQTRFAGDSEIYDIRLLPEGKIVAAGYTFDPALGRTVFAAACYNSNGSLDKKFGKKGRVTLPPIESAGGDFAYGVALGYDRRIMLAGETRNSGGYSDFALACLQPAQGFEIGMPDVAIVTRGTKITVPIIITRFGGFTGELTLTRPASVTGIKVKPAEVLTTGDMATFKLVIKPDAPIGSQQLVFTCVDSKGNRSSATISVAVLE